jgi:hypothetical protein
MSIWSTTMEAFCEQVASSAPGAELRCGRLRERRLFAGTVTHGAAQAGGGRAGSRIGEPDH